MYSHGEKVPRIDKWFEAEALASADAVVTTTRPIASALQGRVPQERKRVRIIPNGYDEEDFAEPPKASAPLRTTILHAGATIMARAEGFLDALEKLAKTKGQLDHLEVRFVGWQARNVSQRVANSSCLGSLVTLEPTVPHEEAIRLMQTSSVLLLLQGRGAYWGQFHSGKAFEYLRSGVPILAVVPEGADAELVQKTGTGCVVDPADTEGISNFLMQIIEDYAGFKARYYQPDHGVIAQYERRQLTERLAQILDEVVSA
jgi:glycosyltransferase involved in cell wall biosynthesis